MKREANLAMAGGGAKGLTYVGALKYFEDHRDKLWITGLHGTSAGAIIATAWACGLNHKKIVDIIKELGVSELYGIHSRNPFTLIHTALKSRFSISKKVMRVFEQYFSWDKVRIPLTICTVDGENKEPVYITSEKQQIPLADAVYCSMRIPFIFKEYVWGNRYILDGGFMDNNCSGMLSHHLDNILIHHFPKGFLNDGIADDKKINNVFDKALAIIETMFQNGIYNGRDKFKDEISVGSVTKDLLDFRDEIVDLSVQTGYDMMRLYFENKSKSVDIKSID
jgi:predicted acylesterase/phospholipase RssA